MSDEIKQRFGFVDEKLNDVKADVLEIRKGVSDIQTTLNHVVQIQAVHAKILEQQHSQLAEHIRRTNLLEERVEQVSSELRSELRPIESHVVFINKAFKAVSWVVGIVAQIAGIIKVLFL